jgi:ferredoxin-NADP reductase
VTSRLSETDTAVRLTLEVPTWPGNDPGAHVDVRLTAPDGYQATRSYSIASSGDATQVVLVVEELPGGEVSPFLVHNIAEGEELEVHGPLGRYFVWTSSDPDRCPVQLIAGGSGIVPLFSMASAREREADHADFRLLYSARTPRDLFFRGELAALAQTNVDIVHTREAPSGSVRPPARLTRDEISRLTFPASARPRIYVCGSTPFVETIARALVELGHEPARIRTERFGGTS